MEDAGAMWSRHAAAIRLRLTEIYETIVTDPPGAT